MKKLNYEGIEIVGMYLEKLELLNEKERGILIQTIHLLNNPMYISDISSENKEILGLK